MKTITTSKRLVSVLLALIMVVSMCTVAFVNTFAAETDTAETGATITGGTTFYLNAKFWDASDATERYAAYFCNGSSAAHWYSAYGPNEDGYYWVTVNAGESHANIIWCRMDSANTTNDWAYKWNQTGDLTWDGSKNLFTISAWDGQTSGWSSYTPPSSEDESSEDPTTPFDPTDVTQICFRDDTSDSIDDNYDTNIFVSFDNGTTKSAMTKTVDTMSGHDMWVIDKPESGTTVKFYGVKATDKKFKGSALYTWTASYSGCTTGLYRATSTSAGAWGTSSEPYAVPDSSDINNYSFGIWADIHGDGNAFDCVVARKLSSSEFDLYLPSNTPNPVKLYTSFASLKIGSTTVTDGAAVTLNAGTSYSMTYKQTEYDSSNKTATLNVYRTLDSSSTTEGVATLLLHTERPLFTELAVSMSGEYKDYKEIDTKGSYYMYDEDGEWVNTPKTEDDGSITDRTGLKKIKGRGNSTFEASMKLYGKYAYNINLDETVELIDGAQKSKKWCLLANNVDHSMMRNSFIYSLGDDIGLKYSPETRLVNLYNNGNYMGAYVITEKVEYGKNTLMHGTDSLDKYHEELFNNEATGFDYEDNIEEATATHSATGVSYQYAKGTGDFTFEHTDEKYKEYNFLLEFELSDRYQDEYSWFVSPKGQAVVVKYPEFATQNEMEWIIEQFVAVESAVYNNAYDTYKELIDVDSFAKMYLIQELTKNLDSASTSYYIHNDQTTGKLAASPVWDYDWSMGSYYKYKPVKGGGNSAALDNPEQWFVKNKSMDVDPFDSDTTGSNTYNFQAQLAQQSDFWEDCQRIWSNDMYAAIGKYVDTDATGTADSGIIIEEWYPRFKSALDMNFARWYGYGSNGSSEDWGTKRTRGYKYGSYNFSAGETSISGTTATDDWGNTIYYLNDWLVKRSKWMNDNGLYNEDLVDPYKLNSVTMNATQSGADVTVSVDFDATYNGTQVANTYKAYDLYVNGELYGNYAITETPVVTLEENVETSIYAIAYLTGDKDAYNMKSSTKKFTYEVTGPEYVVEGVKFDAVQSADESTVTVTPAATVTVDGVEIKPELVNYTIYLNGAVYVTNTFATPSVDVSLVDGQVNEIYVKVSPAADPSTSGTSLTEKFSYNVAAEKVTVTINFKSSGSVRYQPKIKVNGNEVVSMTKGTQIGKNASQTQTYNWYYATVELELDKATNVTFTNSYSMNATIAVTPTDDAVYHFAVDNMNQGTEVVDLSQYNTSNEHDQLVLNFKQSASHMVYSSANDPELATTSINGTVYKLGDSDGDNTLTVLDATTTQMALADKTELSAIGSAVTDYNLDGVSSIMDVTLTQTYLAQ
ncbi:MAG: CotH kinase family protein [Ruminococcus sp.]|nr:CotH kinase family protein [Ruminococcus sp.]